MYDIWIAEIMCNIFLLVAKTCIIINKKTFVETLFVDLYFFDYI